jgi:aspartate carbamoyltransferase catalytic subunit
MVGADPGAVPGLRKLPCCFLANAGGGHHKHPTQINLDNRKLGV